MHLRHRCFLALFAVLAFVPAAALAQTNFVATIDGSQEVPPTPSPGSGFGTFVLNSTQTQLTIHVEYGGLLAPETGSHIHNAPAGVNGGIVFPLPLGSPKDVVWSIPAAMVTELFAQRLYVNIHSSAFPGGEIRGQIVAGPTPTRPGTWGRIKMLYR